MEPLNFGPGNGVFGIFQASQGVQSLGKILICPPLFVDFYRTHQIIKEAAGLLSMQGYETLRFDLRGTGDSAKNFNEVSVRHWMEDIRSAYRELQDLSGDGKSHVIGIRISGLLALQALQDDVHDISSFTLWDPITSGSRYVDDLAETHAHYVAKYQAVRGAPPNLLDHELAGFECHQNLAHEFRTLEIRSLMDHSQTRANLRVLQSQNENCGDLRDKSHHVTDIDANCGWNTMDSAVLFDKAILNGLVKLATLAP